MRCFLQTAAHEWLWRRCQIKFFCILEASSHREHIWLLTDTDASSLLELALECIDSTEVLFDNSVKYYHFCIAQSAQAAPQACEKEQTSSKEHKIHLRQPL